MKTLSEKISSLGHADILNQTGGVDSNKFYGRLFDLLNGMNVLIRSFPLNYGNSKEYKFVRLTSPHIDDSQNSKIVVCGSNIHAYEIAGLLFWLQHGREIFDYAHQHNVCLIGYPLRNPAGVELIGENPQQRYNGIELDGEYGNDDFLRYRLSNGSYVDDMGSSDNSVGWEWASDVPDIRLPLETKKMIETVRGFDIPVIGRIKAVIDLHQEVDDRDSMFLVAGGLLGKKPKHYKKPGSYFYSFDKDNSIYIPVIDQIEKLGIPILRNTRMYTGYANGKPDNTDQFGGTIRYDGSWPAAMYENGVKHCITAESTMYTPLNEAIEINRIWMKSLIDLAAKSIILN